MKISREEIEALRNAIYSYLHTHTEHEVHGHLTLNGIITNEVLRNLFMKIIEYFNMKEEYSKYELLFIGLDKFLSDRFLKKQIREDGKYEYAQEEEVAQYALFCLNKKKG